MTAEQERQVALLLKDRILAETDQPIRQIILYGSRTQGRGRPDSDFDLLVVAADPVVKHDEAAIAYVFNGRAIRGRCVDHRGDGV